jgi:hypothetical protein
MVLVPSCGKVACHAPGPGYGDFVTDPASLIGRRSIFGAVGSICRDRALIEPTLPVRGLLFDRLLYDACGPGTRMPMAPAPRLTEAEIQCLVSWATALIDPRSTPSGTGGRSGGTGGRSGGTGGAGGSTITCPAASEIISDFSSGTNAGVNPVAPRLGGWSLYYEGDGSAAGPPNTGRTVPPKVSGAGIPRSIVSGGPCSGPGSLQMQAIDIVGWGVGVSAALVTPTSGGKVGQYDATAYRGVRAWVRCTTEIRHVNLLVYDGNTDFDAPSPMCTSYGDCVPHGVWNATVGPDGMVLEVDFVTAVQNPSQIGVTAIPTIDPSKLTSVHVRFDADYVGSVAQPVNFDCMIDDVRFYR